jgi:hypothetical protein
MQTSKLTRNAIRLCSYFPFWELTLRAEKGRSSRARSPASFWAGDPNAQATPTGTQNPSAHHRHHLRAVIIIIVIGAALLIGLAAAAK